VQNQSSALLSVSSRHCNVSSSADRKMIRSAAIFAPNL
jgi:hypothetical protein